MAIFSTSADTSTTITATTTGNIWIVNAGVEVTTTGRAINGAGTSGNKSFLIHGQLIAELEGIYLGHKATGTGGGNQIDILRTGSIFAESHAVESYGGYLELSNEGSLFSIDTAIFAEDGNNIISNIGSIWSSNAGISIYGGYSRINNTGTIDARSNGISAQGTDNAILNGGVIAATYNGIAAGDGYSQIANSGSIASSASNGVLAEGGNNIVGNDGSITGWYNGITGGASRVTNTGTIAATTGAGIAADFGDNIISNIGDIVAATDGIYVSGTGNLIVNLGSVVTSSISPAPAALASTAAVAIDSTKGDFNRLVNAGELSSQIYAVLGGAGNETVVNRGAMNGDVGLGLGNDRFKGWSGTVNGDIHGGGGSDTLIGGADDDAIFGDSGADMLRGGDGDDTLTGGTGRDILRGGPGADTFDFNKTAETTVGGQRDRIADFARGEDVIDLSSIDADSGLAGNQAFAFIGASAFSAVGQLRVTTTSGNTIVAGDTDGDGNADFEILVLGVTGLTAGDFVL
jgi:Ca2+-binding RTX toxin-like protein